MPIYRCETCKFVSDRLSNYNRHMNSTKHLERFQEHTQSIINSYNTNNTLINSNNNTTNNITNNINNSVILCGFRHEDLSQITEEDILSCFNAENKYNCVPAFIKITNCNPRFPQNMNVVIKRLDRNYMEVYDEKEKDWKTVRKSDELDTFFQEKDMELEEQVYVYQDKHKHLRKEYDKFSLRCKEDPVKGQKSFYELCIENVEYLLHDACNMIINNKKKL